MTESPLNNLIIIIEKKHTSITDSMCVTGGLIQFMVVTHQYHRFHVCDRGNYSIFGGNTYVTQKPCVRPRFHTRVFSHTGVAQKIVCDHRSPKVKKLFFHNYKSARIKLYRRLIIAHCLESVDQLKPMCDHGITIPVRTGQ